MFTAHLILERTHSLAASPSSVAPMVHFKKRCSGRLTAGDPQVSSPVSRMGRPRCDWGSPGSNRKTRCPCRTWLVPRPAEWRNWRRPRYHWSWVAPWKSCKTQGRRVNSRAEDVEAVLLLQELRGRACCCDSSSQGRQTASLKPVFKDSSVPRHQTVICSEFLNFYFWLSFLWQCFTA